MDERRPIEEGSPAMPRGSDACGSTEVLMIGRQLVRELLPMSECIEVIQHALEATARGQTLQLLRTIMDLPGDDRACLGIMPGYMADPECFGVKVVAVLPDNSRAGLQPHQGTVMLFERRQGRPLAIMHGGEITAIRTAAASAVATRALARSDAEVLAILGYGEQARTHLAAMLLVRGLNRVIVWGRVAARAREFAQEQEKKLGIPIEVAASAAAAVARADIVCTTTAAAEPILSGAAIPPGCHLNVVGSSVAKFREIDSEALRRSRLFVDHKPMTVTAGGEYLVALREGAIDESHILGEIGEVLLGKCPGRRTKGDITLYKSLGMPVEDLASAMHVYRKARRLDLGTAVDF